LDDLEKEEYFNRERSLMYVAMTRAINILKISGVGVKSEMIGL
jgi:superfamily I DNA/RNA helicase